VTSFLAVFTDDVPAPSPDWLPAVAAGAGADA
jgi:hypothetical protein